MAFTYTARTTTSSNTPNKVAVDTADTTAAA